MKGMFFFFLMVFSVSVLATGTSLPESYCRGPEYNCSAHQKSLVQAYQQKGKVPNFPAQAGVYAGSCFMLSKAYDPNQEQHGYIYINKVDGKYNFNAQFAFFYEADPYKDLTLLEAQREYPEVSPYFLEKSAKEWFVLIHEQAAWSYYIREVAKNRLVFVGLRGHNESVICDLHTREEK